MLLPILASLTHASGFDAPQVGSVDSGPLTADPAAVVYNPALLARLDRPTLLVGAGLVAGRARYRRERRGTYGFADDLVLTVPDEADPTRTGLADPIGATPVAPLGDLFAATPLGPAALGLGVSVPYAAVLAYPDDGAQRFALQRTSLLVGQLSLGAAVATGPLSVGATIDTVLGSGSLARVQDFAGLEFFSDVVESPPLSQPNDFGRQAPSDVREQDVLGRDIALRGLAVHATFGAGIALDLGRSRLAASYAHGSPVVFRGRFALDLDDPVFTNDLAPFGLQYPPQVEGDSDFSVATPRRLRLGLATALGDDRELRLTVTGSDWTRYAATDIELVSPDLAQPALGLSDT
ncbi:MAG: outer membrane protein transport protein, partial [Myxococcota bacterium]